MTVAALVVAAGRGQRFGGSRPKQYAPLAGRPLLRYSLEVLARHPAVGHVMAVIHPDDEALYAEAARGLALLPATPGGASRQESVRRGLEALEGLAPDAVLVHDGARPFLDAPLIDRVLGALGDAEGAVPGLSLTDTIKRAEPANGTARVTETLDRSTLWRAQTPQGFRFGAILAAHRAAAGLNELTDDAAVAERAGLQVVLVPGSEENVKVTTPQDLVAAERRLGERPAFEPRIGQGFDVHRFGPGDRVVLCGIEIPFSQGLLGHSDADVGLHALTDALLGALGAGDIGSHFPPSDPQWRGVDSAVFLRHAVGLVTARGGRIGNLDITLICERPKIGPHREAMVGRVAALTGLAAERVSIKATTTERLGFTGRGEGIAAQAVVALAMPVRPAAAD